jgi:hypothetical protein
MDVRYLEGRLAREAAERAERFAEKEERLAREEAEKLERIAREASAEKEERLAERADRKAFYKMQEMEFVRLKDRDEWDLRKAKYTRSAC